MQDGRNILMRWNLSCKDVVWSITGPSFGGEMVLVNLNVFGSLV